MIDTTMKELCRVTKKWVILGFPDRARVNGFGTSWLLNKLFRRIVGYRQLINWGFSRLIDDINEQQYAYREDAHNPHYWEVNTRSFSKNSIIRRLNRSGFEIQRNLHNPLHAHHWCVVCYRKIRCLPQARSIGSRT